MNTIQGSMPTANNSPSTKDVELATVRDGYPALAAWMACDLDDETFIFRRFSNLAARNILHLQAQLFALEREILDADAAARRPGAIVSSMRWETLMRDSKDPERPEHKRVQDINRLKDLLKDYCMPEHLLLYDVDPDGDRRGAATTITDRQVAETK